MPVFEIQGPDGRTYEVDAPDQSAALSAFHGFSGQAQPEDANAAREATKAEFDALPTWQKPFKAADDIVRLAANGLTFGLADRIAGHIGGDGAEAERAKSRAAMDRAGSAGVAAELGGSIAGVGKLAGAGVTAGRFVPAAMKGAGGLAARSAAGAVDALAINEAMNAGYGRDFGENAGVAAVAGAAAPAVAAGASKLGSKILGRFNPKPSVMTSEQLKQAASDAYQQVDDAGVIFSPQASTRLRNAVQSDMADFGYDPILQPGASAAFNRLEQNAGRNVTMKGMDVARRVAGNAFQPGNKSNNALTAKIIDRIDEVTMNPQAGDVIGGDSGKAASALKTAREMTKRQKKLELVNELLERARDNAGASGSGGNIENASRQQLKRLLSNPKYRRGLTPDELSAVKDAVLGTNKQNLLRLIGKLSPQGNGLMLLGHGVGLATAPMLSLPAAAVGYGAKKAAEGMTASNATYLKNLIASGGNAAAMQPVKNAAQRVIENQRDRIARALMVYGLSRQNASQNKAQ